MNGGVLGDDSDGFAVPRQILSLLNGFDPPWWVAGGWAVDLFVRRLTRPHKDIEIALFRHDQSALQEYLAGWSLRKVVDHRLIPWLPGELLTLPVHEIHGRGPDGHDFGAEFAQRRRPVAKSPPRLVRGAYRFRGKRPIVCRESGHGYRMLTRLSIRNFKRFGELVVELGNPVVFIGPNNSGKTSAMQALALWDVGLKRWTERRGGRKTPEKRPGVTVNRRDLVSIPVPEANLLWRNLRVRDVRTVDGRPRTSNIRIDIVVDGVTDDHAWTCGLEFDYANEESFYCRPLRVGGGSSERMEVPDEAAKVRIAFLPPMSGLAATEARLDAGSVNVRIGEGRTAEVLRNLCYTIHQEREDRWEQIVAWIRRLFGAELQPPRYLPERGEITMSYREGGTALDLSSSGRGLQQTLLLLAYLYANPGSLLLLDEPDAHLEILRQRQTYHLLSEVARDTGCQVIAASHSEVILNEAAGRDTVVAFVGAPHRIDDRGSQALKALTEIGFEQYFQAHQTGWVLYLRSSTDLAVLQAFARRLGHETAAEALSRPFVRYVANNASEVTRHYQGLREAVPDLRGIALFDRLPEGAPDLAPVECLVWERREIGNYLCTRRTLEAYAAASSDVDRLGSLFAPPEVERRSAAMRDAIAEVEAALAANGTGLPWSADLRAGEQILEPILAAFFRELDLPVANRSVHELVEHVPENEIAPDVTRKLDAIARVAAGASPAPGP